MIYVSTINPDRWEGFFDLLMGIFVDYLGFAFWQDILTTRE